MSGVTAGALAAAGTASRRAAAAAALQPRRLLGGQAGAVKTVDLNAIEVAGGADPPVIFVHGLYGSCGNFRSIMRQCSKLSGQSRPFYSVDLRNHGASPWSDYTSVTALAADLRDFVEHRELGPSVLVGHSLGGRAAMAAALNHPGVVDRLMVVDMSPESGVPLSADDSDGEGGVASVGRAMRDMPREAMQTRASAEAFLSERLESKMVVQWALQNLLFPKGEEPRWRLNLDALVHSLSKHEDFDLDSDGRVFEGETLFLHGSRSPYVSEARHGPLIRALFPRAELRSLDTGHLVHAERPKEFIQEVMRFIV